jgi:abequosyltransferase
MTAPLLSICIATFRRAAYLPQTLDSILDQWQPGVELVVVDGASPDETPDIMARYLARHPFIVYRREPTNSGVDADFDKAVAYASGDYCWLMSDDDLLATGALVRVLQELRESLEPPLDLLVLNTEVRNRDLRMQLMAARAPVEQDRTYGEGDAERLFSDACLHLSFIANTVVRRALWLQRERSRYYGCFFIHIGVLFQAPVARAKFLAAPLVVMRDGNANWTPRSFEIWMRRWPELVWSFQHYSVEARERVTPRHPAHSTKMLAWLRGLGGYGRGEYAGLRSEIGVARRLAALLLAHLPGRLVNALVASYCAVSRDPARRMKLYSLVTAPSASAWTRVVAARSGVTP